MNVTTLPVQQPFSAYWKFFLHCTDLHRMHGCPFTVRGMTLTQGNQTEPACSSQEILEQEDPADVSQNVHGDITPRSISLLC